MVISKPKPKLTGGTPSIDFILFCNRDLNGVVVYSPDVDRQDRSRKLLLSHGTLSVR